MFWLPHSLSLASLQETVHLLLLHIRPIPAQRDEAIFEMLIKKLMKFDAYLHPDRFSHSSMHCNEDFWSVSNPPPPKT